MTTETFILSAAYPDCTLTTYIHEPFEELRINARRAIIVCPGGGYQFLSDRESEPVALQYFAAGLNVFILRYSINEKARGNAPLIEAATAVRHVRENAEKYHVDPKYVFITGFSAGGHVAACCGTMWKDAAVLAAMGDAPYGIWKPTATVLCYPVITATARTHFGSIDTVSGGHGGEPETIERWSVEKHVDADTAPAFVWHTFDDGAVPIQNTLLYVNAMAEAGVPFEYHVYPSGVHGLSLANKETWVGQPGLDVPAVAGWIRDAIRYVTEF
jgi:acetyl esterase/lipase